MLKSIQIENFKCFSDSGRIRLAPITLIFGANSSGKSSILQSLYLLSQTISCDQPKHVLLFTGQHADLQSYENVVFEHDTKRRIALRLDVTPSGWSRDLAVNAYKEWFDRIAPDSMSLRMVFSHDEEAKIRVQEVSLFIGRDEEPLVSYEAGSEKTYLECSKISKNPAYWTWFLGSDKEELKRNIVDALVSHKSDADSSAMRKQYLDLFADDHTFLSLYLGSTSKIENEDWFLPGQIHYLERECIQAGDAYDMLVEGILERIYGKDIIYSFDPAYLVNIAAFDLYEAIKSIRIIGSLRADPHRCYQVGKTSKVRQAGDETPYLLQADPKNLQMVNKWLEELDTGYELDVCPFADVRGSGYELRFRNLSRREPLWVGFPDLGFGMSQVLPIIAKGLTHNGTILIEQPETHIHPALQARLGTFFAECIKRERPPQFIIETHSEHLILRLQRLIRTGQLRPDQLSVIYVRNEPGGAKARQMELDEDGEFVDEWPGGFFAERLREFLD